MSTAQDDDPGGFLTRWSRRKVQLRHGGVRDEPARPGPQHGAATAPDAAVTRPLPSGAAVVVPPFGSPATTALAQAPAAAADVVQPTSQSPLPAPGAPADLSPPPTLADVAALDRDSDFSRFVAPGVQGDVRNAALQKLFTDPHFNIMDGLDTYIDDYGKPDPLPAHWLRKMVQSQSLGLFDDEKAEAEPATTAAVSALPAAALPPAATATRSDAAAASGRIPDNPISQDSNTHEDADLRLQPDYAAGPASPGASAEPDTGGQR